MAKQKYPPANGTAEVEAYLARLDHPLKAEIEAVRAIIKGVAPGITEQVKWNAPTFSYKGYLVTIHVRTRDRVHLVFHNAAILNDTSGLLEGDYVDRRMAYFKDMRDVRAKRAALEGVVSAWVRLKDAG